MVEPSEGGLRASDLETLAGIARLSSRGLGPIELAAQTATILWECGRLPAVAVYGRSGEGFARCASAGPPEPWSAGGFEPAALTGRTAAGRPLLEPLAGETESPAGSRRQLESAFRRVVVPIVAGDVAWGLLAAAAEPGRPLGQRDATLIEAAAAVLGTSIGSALAREDLARRLRRSEALRAVGARVGDGLDLGQILAVFIDNAIVLFGADRAAAFLSRPDGRLQADASRGLSQAYCDAVREPGRDGLMTATLERGETLCATRYADDTRARSVRDAVSAEGFDTICCSPLVGDGKPLGVLAIYHDAPHAWGPDELATLAELSAEAGVAIRTAQTYAQMAAWAAQLQSIQQLGSRLARLTTVGEIATAIALELRQVIDYQNVRVYRVAGDRLLAVARDGQASEYAGETPQSLELAIGQGITGWVAQHGSAVYLPDAARDDRTQVIPGTDGGVEESMILAPMLFEGRVLGVLVLSKLGLHQFGEDDLRLLVIYAMFAAQAMANADTTERLRAQTVRLGQQLRSQRELLQITESILGSLDSTAIVGQITERLFALVRYDRVAVELGDPAGDDLDPVASRETRPEPAGLSRPPSVLEVPLRSPGRVTGRLKLTRFGDQPAFEPHEVELVRLFAGHVSIALQNAQAHQDAETRARTDGLTGLLNQGTLGQRLRDAVAAGERFSLIMLDLDDFKAINDRMGHPAGDVALQAISRAIVGAARESDVVFRYGGDEFALLLPGTRAPGAHELADRIRLALHAVRLGRRSRDQAGARDVSASIGIAAFPDDGATADEVLLAADRACYVAKRGGRDRIANAEDGRALAEEFTLQTPTPVDSSGPSDQA